MHAEKCLLQSCLQLCLGGISELGSGHKQDLMHLCSLHSPCTSGSITLMICKCQGLASLGSSTLEWFGSMESVDAVLVSSWV